MRYVAVALQRISVAYVCRFLVGCAFPGVEKHSTGHKLREGDMKCLRLLISCIMPSARFQLMLGFLSVVALYQEECVGLNS